MMRQKDLIQVVEVYCFYFSLYSLDQFQSIQQARKGVTLKKGLFHSGKP